MPKLTKQELRQQRGKLYNFLPNKDFSKNTEYLIIQKYKVTCLFCNNIYYYRTIADHIGCCPCNPANEKYNPQFITCLCGGKYASASSKVTHEKGIKHITFLNESTK
jgi:hypothetical protein